MLTRKVFSATALAFCTFSSTPSCAEIYKWVDANGVTHYSDESASAPAGHQPVGQKLPALHLIEKPDPELTRVQQKAARERRKGRRVSRPTRRRPSNGSRCETYQQQLNKVQKQLRRGYREPRGNKLRERRRNIQAKINAECR